jgi:glutaconate CoA-transferase subunit B
MTDIGPAPVSVADRIIWRLARECRADDVLIVGVATPLATAAGLLARALLVPDLTLLVAASVQPSQHDLAQAMLAADYVASISVGTFGQAEILDLIQRGSVTLQFVSPAQIDRRGRINASAVRRPDGSLLTLPGPLALPDVACLVGRLVGYRAAHSPRFLVDEVDYLTGLGSADLALRARAGLTGRGLDAVVTDRAVLRFRPRTGTVALESVAPDVTVEDAVAGCGFPLEVGATTPHDEPPPAEALDLLNRVIDPHRLRGLEVPAEREPARVRWEALSR